MTGGKRSCPGPAGQHSLILPDPGATKKVTGGEVARWGVLFHSVVGTVARFHAGDSSPAVMGKFRAGPGDQRESSRNIVGGVQPEKTEGAMYVVHYSRIRGTPAWTR